MGQDDANVGEPGGCPGHDFAYEQLVVVRDPGRLMPGLGMELRCRLCGASAYEASATERG